jgi:hypothetical protein
VHDETKKEISVMENCKNNQELKEKIDVKRQIITYKKNNGQLPYKGDTEELETIKM